MAWKTYSWVLTAVFAISYITTFTEGITVSKILDVPITIVALLGLFGYAYKKQISKRLFWRFWLCLLIIWDITQNWFLTKDAEAPSISATVLSVILILPLYIALYRYSSVRMAKLSQIRALNLKNAQNAERSREFLIFINNVIKTYKVGISVVSSIIAIITIGVGINCGINLFEESDFFLFEYSRCNISYERLKKTPVADLIPFDQLPIDVKYNVTYITGRDYTLVISFKLPEDKLNKFMQQIQTKWNSNERGVSSEWGDENDNHWGGGIPTAKCDAELNHILKFFVYPKSKSGMTYWYVIPEERMVIFHKYTT